MLKPLLILIGCFFTGLALIGALLPGIPTTVFLIVALWAFARSSERMTRWIERVPILQSALKEARRFEERRAIRPAVKATALIFAWASAAITAGVARSVTQPVVIGVALAAVAASLAMVWIPTDHSHKRDAAEP